MGTEISWLNPNISASVAKFENLLDDPEDIRMRGSQLKNEPIWTSSLGCKGGAIDFERSSYNSGTSVFDCDTQSLIV